MVEAEMPACIEIDRAQLTDFWRQHRTRRLALFGSVLRDDFRPDSDVDVLVEFEKDAHLDLLDFVGIQKSLESLFGRDFDLVSAASLRNPFRRRAVLSRQETIYAA
jgi:hypothetical protein